MVSRHDDGWLLENLAAEIRFNDPRTEVVLSRRSENDGHAERNETEDVQRAR